MKGIKVRQYVDLLFTVIACIGTNFIHILAGTWSFKLHNKHKSI